MSMICEYIDRLYEWAYDAQNGIEAFCKEFVTGFIDGWLYATMIIGNIVCLIGLIVMFKKPTEEDYED